ncbi:PAS domain S-box-containing protein [Flavobacterium sp. CF108]|uniref:PAS domain-containing sensor histidine kinase n=1 Tax=unclassified Flavobacterium TaxID=196869 RepID=UPI0008C476D9|nr:MULTISPECIES: PAS domain-containing protein [unclassified Flavobacterium]SEO40515.1 PAS domain S-box-containing protein [Flavobacterium sp. fv08]SHH66879.1 PAS domain S-box-containing protein [Flavobacterium sp. CF108]
MIFDLYSNEDCLEVNNFYRKLFAEMPDLLFQFVIDPNNHYTFPLVSKSVDEIFELSFKEFTDDTKDIIYERVFEQDREIFFQSLVKARKEIVPWKLEFRSVLPKKGLRWFKVSAKTELSPDGKVSFFGHISDITDLKDKEEKLRISEERFQFALEASTVGIWDWDMVTNNVFYSSLSLKILELESADIFDDPERWDKIVHPDDLPKYYSDIKEHFDNKIPYYENYHRVMTSSGNYKWILDRGKVIKRDENGKPLRVIGTHTDISLQKEKELELLRTMKLYSDQNSRLLNFSHIVSHNLNTQAGNIKSILDFIDEDGDKGTVGEMLEHLRTVSNDLNETISNLTQIVKTQSNINIAVEPLKLCEYIEKTVSAIKGYDKQKKVTIVNNVPKYLTINFNPAYLESVLLNFTTNAIKYAHPDRDPLIVFDFGIEPEGYKSLKITDNGLGIDLKVYGELLFGMYKTFHKHDEARGIGLYITRNQIEAMKGTVSVESEVGVGTSFKIVFNDL